MTSLVLWGKQAADDDSDGMLKSQKKADADAAVWLQVVSAPQHSQ